MQALTDGAPRDAIAQIHAAVETELRESVPLFTKPIARGLGAAESPSVPVSFGDHRCNLAARALWRSFLCRRRPRDRRTAPRATFAAVYKEQGLDPRFPYLGAGSTDDYQLPIACEVPVRCRTLSDAGVIASRRTISPRDAAFRIGESLCRHALWDSTGRYCNWIGRVRIGESECKSPTGVVAAALGPGLREGSAGIALFLAHLHAVTGDEEFRRTAQGAIARSRLPCDGPARDIPTAVPRGPRKAREAAMHSLLAATHDAEFKERRLAQARTAITLVLEAIDATHRSFTIRRDDLQQARRARGIRACWRPICHWRSLYLARARNLAQTLIDRYSEQDNWPTGLPRRWTRKPINSYLGTAGIGYWLLRVDEPERSVTGCQLGQRRRADNPRRSRGSMMWPPGWSQTP